MINVQPNPVAAPLDSPSDAPLVSVIIPVFNDAKRLQRCLDALEHQTYPKQCYEVIVVDNGSDPEQNIQGVVAQFSQAIATCELMPGSYAARNQGIRLARGEIIAFTDADCIPAPDWLEKGVQHLLSRPNCGLVAGKIELFFQNPDRATAVELYESVTAFPQRELLETRKAGATANVFTWKAVIDRVGLFNAQMKSNGDMEWGGRVFAAGYEQIYADDVRVLHPARYSFEQLHKRTVRLAGGVYNFYIKPEDPFWKRHKTFARLLLNDLTPPVNFVINTLKDDRLKGLNQKLKVSAVIFFVRFVSAREKIRLKLGGVPSRG